MAKKLKIKNTVTGEVRVISETAWAMIKVEKNPSRPQESLWKLTSGSSEEEPAPAKKKAAGAAKKKETEDESDRDSSEEN